MTTAIPIIDAHCHIWHLERLDYPWLAPGSAQPRFGDHSALQRTYDIDDYAMDMAGLDLRGAVFVEADCADGDAENEWISAKVGRSPFPFVHVASANLTDTDALGAIEKIAARRTSRGIRWRLNYPGIAPRPGIFGEPQFRRNIGYLREHGLLFEVSIFPPQAEEAMTLALDFPEVTFVVNHLAWPRYAAGDDSFADWRQAVHRLGSAENMAVKMSMLWPIDRDWRSDIVEPFVRETMSAFGPERVLFGSNYPIEALMCPVQQQVQTLTEILADIPADELGRVFYDNAARIYGLAAS